MIENVSHTQRAGPTAPAGPALPPGRAAPAPPSSGDLSLPDSPPPEVAEGLAAAQGVLRDLDRAQVRLRFEVEETEAGRRVRVDVIDAEGRVIRTIPPSRLGSLFQGRAGGGLLVDQRG